MSLTPLRLSRKGPYLSPDNGLALVNKRKTPNGTKSLKSIQAVESPGILLKRKLEFRKSGTEPMFLIGFWEMLMLPV